MAIRFSVGSVPIMPMSRKMIFAAGRVDEHVAGVRVAVEEAVVEHLLDDGAHKGDGHSGAVDARLVEGIGVGDFDAPHELLGHDAPRREAGVDDRDVHGGEHGHVLRQQATAERLIRIVKLKENVVGVLGHDAVEVGVARPGKALRQQPRQVAHHVEVGAHGDVDVGALHLDHHLLAAEQGGDVHLRRGGRGQRLMFDGCVHLGQRLAQLALDDLSGLFPGERLDFALQLGKLHAPFRRQLLGAAGDNLAEFDIGWAEILQQKAHHLRRRFVDVRVLFAIDDALEEAAHRSKGRQVEGDVLQIAHDGVQRLGDAQVFGEDVAPAKCQLPDHSPVARPFLGLILERAIQPSDAFEQHQQEREKGGADHCPEPHRFVDDHVFAAGKERYAVKQHGVDDDEKKSERPQQEAPGERQHQRPEQPVPEREGEGQEDIEHELQHDLDYRKPPLHFRGSQWSAIDCAGGRFGRCGAGDDQGGCRRRCRRRSACRRFGLVLELDRHRRRGVFAALHHEVFGRQLVLGVDVQRQPRQQHEGKPQRQHIDANAHNKVEHAALIPCDDGPVGTITQQAFRLPGL
jgi:hypothetical protein